MENFDAIFHSQDNLYFIRHSDGSITILKTTKIIDHTYTIHDALNDMNTTKTTLMKFVWASAMASMSAYTETSESFQQALKFHNGTN